MWRLYNYLFGWNYVIYSDGAAHFIAKVIETPNGRLMLGGKCRKHYDNYLQENYKVGLGKWSPLTWREPNKPVDKEPD